MLRGTTSHDSGAAKQILLRVCAEGNSHTWAQGHMEGLIKKAYPDANRHYRRILKDAFVLDPKRDSQRLLELSKTRDRNILEILIRRPDLPNLHLFNVIRPGNPKELILYAMQHRAIPFVLRSAIRSGDKELVEAAMANPNTEPLEVIDALDGGRADGKALILRLEEMFRQ